MKLVIVALTCLVALAAACPPAPKHKRFMEKDIPGHDVQHFPVKNVEHCAHECHKRPRHICGAWTYRPKDRFCLIKSAKPGGRGVRVVPKPGLISSFRC